MTAHDINMGTQSLDRAIAILRLVANRSGRGIRLTDITQQSGLAKPTAHRILRALQRQGLIDQDAGTDLYHLGPETFVLGTLAAERYGIHRASLPSLARLAAQSADTCFLTALRGWHGVCLHREEGGFPIRTHALQAGDRHPLGVGAGSLAILAALTDEQVEMALAANAEELSTCYPLFTRDFLLEEVELTRRQNYAFNPGRFVPGSWAVGVAIMNQRGQCEGAVSIAAIDQRLQKPRRQEIAEMLQAEAQRISQMLADPSRVASSPQRQTASASRR